MCAALGNTRSPSHKGTSHDTGVNHPPPSPPPVRPGRQLASSGRCGPGQLAANVSVTQVTDAAPVAIPTASKRRAVITLTCTAVVAALGWATFYLLQSLPQLSPDGRPLLYYAGRHTSTWWSVPTFALAALSSLVLTGQLGLLA